ncbi:MAG: NAD(P)/FAD-dependent oxidoreductase [Leptospiraceae bacterium]|jgi:NADH dehydrogenase|nr:NAD(P)/FAD-dependent oxidoreductase [Leptospiraceae bacterium]MCZ8346285.1 NAD(P)/FAD-dependent oxidoreductase [Leptospiraceae bacterium]PJE00684.1 MAG: pyridine nucleotide-disulfide oxidoreductase [Leptospira sp.]
MINKRRVVVVGAGFAGLQIIQKLANQDDLEVILIDKTNHHLFQPLLYQVASAVLSPADIAIPSRSLTSDYENVKVVMGEVTNVDYNKKIVYFQNKEIDYDYLVLAMGARTSFFGNDEWKNYTLGLKSIKDALAIRRKLLLSFEEAELSGDIVTARRLLNYIIVGGGPTGVEMAGAIAELSYHTLRKDFRNIDPGLAKITLIEAGPRLLGGFDESLSKFTQRKLEQRGVIVLTNTPVKKIDQTGVHLEKGVLESKIIIWAAGVQGTTLAEKIGLPLDRSKRIVVNQECRVADVDNVFVVGDAANFQEGLERALPGVSPVAMQQGRYVADWIQRDLKSKKKKPFQYHDKGSMATIGRNDAVAQVGNFKMKGLLGWFAWLFVHLFYQVGFKNKVSILITWVYSYIAFKAGARLIQDEISAEGK